MNTVKCIFGSYGLCKHYLKATVGIFDGFLYHLSQNPIAAFIKPISLWAAVVHTTILRFCAMSLNDWLLISLLLTLSIDPGVMKYGIQCLKMALIISELSLQEIHKDNFWTNLFNCRRGPLQKGEWYLFNFFSLKISLENTKYLSPSSLQRLNPALSVSLMLFTFIIRWGDILKSFHC